MKPKSSKVVRPKKQGASEEEEKKEVQTKPRQGWWNEIQTKGESLKKNLSKPIFKRLQASTISRSTPANERRMFEVLWWIKIQSRVHATLYH